MVHHESTLHVLYLLTCTVSFVWNNDGVKTAKLISMFLRSNNVNTNFVKRNLRARKIRFLFRSLIFLYFHWFPKAINLFFLFPAYFLPFYLFTFIAFNLSTFPPFHLSTFPPFLSHFFLFFPSPFFRLHSRFFSFSVSF